MTGISFCVQTGGQTDHIVQRCIDSITNLNIPEYEIIICGGDTTSIELNDIVKHIPFDEHTNIRWITRKKNISVLAAKYEICVVFHDYIIFDKDWYNGFKEFGTHWDICHHQTIQQNGMRTSGWRVQQYPGLPHICMIPYDVEGLEQFMPIQGNYFCIKRTRYLKDPQDEAYVGYVASDMEWSRRIVPTSHIRCNPKCIVIEGKEMNAQDFAATRHAIQEALQYEHVFQQLRNCHVKNLIL